ncbi:MAG: S8 family serine peptidase [Alphaproteobacteria bacterium]
MPKFVLALFFGVALPAVALAADAYYYSPQNTLIGATPDVQSLGKYGAGITFGIIDTGGTASWTGFQGWSGSKTQGRITRSYCILPCSASALKSGNIDDNGHGTFVTSEIIGGVPAIGLVGVAPAANAIEVKVLNAAGSGTSSGVAQGIIRAANAGAQVLNLSLGPSGTPAQQAAFYQSIASAVNYAATKNTVIVFAGGNNAEAFAGGAGITGFSDAAIARMIFVGSTDAAKVHSSFSNMAGTAGFTSTTGKFTPYTAMWVVADGENIWGASNFSSKQYGYGYMTQMSGTSMAAPQAAGAAGLLAARWPFLLSTGTIPAILTTSAEDLGANGVDAVYGSGFLRIDRAMQPIGTLQIPTSGGKMVAATTASSGRIVSGTAMGSMPGVASALAQAVAYDSYMRGFTLFAASPVTPNSSLAPVSPALSRATGTAGGRARFVSEFAAGWFASSGAPPSSTPNPTAKAFGFDQDPAHAEARTEWSLGLMTGGTYLGIGQGANAALSFSDARWGRHSAFFNVDTTASAALLSVANDARFVSTGFALGEDQRVAMSLVATPEQSSSGPLGTRAGAARGGAFAYTLAPSDRWQISLASSYLDERERLLGTTSTGSFLDMGTSAATTSLGFGADVDLGRGFQVGFDAAHASTEPVRSASSFFQSTSNLESESYTLAFAQRNLTGAGDTLHLTIDKPLRIISGGANMMLPVDTDNYGNPVIRSSRVSLVPDGNETDFGFGYRRPLLGNLSGSFNMIYRSDAGNIAGYEDTAAALRFSADF